MLAGAGSGLDLPPVNPRLAPNPFPTPAMSVPHCCEPGTRSRKSHYGRCPWESRPDWVATTQNLLTLGLVGWPAEILPWPQLGHHTLALLCDPSHSASLSLESQHEIWGSEIL